MNLNIKILFCLKKIVLSIFFLFFNDYVFCQNVDTLHLSEVSSFSRKSNINSYLSQLYWKKYDRNRKFSFSLKEKNHKINCSGELYLNNINTISINNREGISSNKLKKFFKNRIEFIENAIYFSHNRRILKKFYCNTNNDNLWEFSLKRKFKNYFNIGEEENLSILVFLDKNGYIQFIKSKIYKKNIALEEMTIQLNINNEKNYFIENVDVNIEYENSDSLQLYMKISDF